MHASLDSAELDSAPLDTSVVKPSEALEPHPPTEISDVASRGGAIHPCPWWKRAVDLTLAGLAVVVLLPLLMFVAIWIKCVSRGPVFFRQRRYGVGGRPFRIWKFRTLHANEAGITQRDYMAELMESERPMVKRDRQLAIIPGGHLLRKLGIDELPQLINVLRGEMTLVGPRPHVVPIQSYAAWQRPRFDVVPGITGLWQVSDKEQTSFSMMMRMDLEYIRRRSLWLDAMIMLQTFPALARSLLYPEDYSPSEPASN